MSLTENIGRAEGSSTESGLNNLQNQIHWVINRKCSDDTEESQIKDIYHKSNSSTKAIWDVASDW